MTRLRAVLIIGGIVVVASAAAAVVVVPRIVKARIIAAAEAHGVALTIGDLAILPGHARLKNVKAVLWSKGEEGINPDRPTPQISAAAASLDVELDKLTPTAITLDGVSIDLDGSVSAVKAMLEARNHDGDGAPASTFARVVVKDASISWKHPVATERVAIAATHVHGEIARAGTNEFTWHIETADVRAFATPANAGLAPWAASVDHDAAGTRVAVSFAKSAHAKLDFSSRGAFTMDLDTPHGTVADLGMPPEALALSGDQTSTFEIHIHHQQVDADHADGTAVVTANNIFLGASMARTSFALDTHYSGDPKSALKLSAGTLKAGPFTGPLDGTFTVAPQVPAFGAKLHYSSGVMACIDAVKAQAANYGDIGKGAAALAGVLGLDRAVEGRISLKGDIDVDSQTNTSHFAFHTEGDCKLSYLPSL